MQQRKSGSTLDTLIVQKMELIPFHKVPVDWLELSLLQIRILCIKLTVDFSDMMKFFKIKTIINQTTSAKLKSRAGAY